MTATQIPVGNGVNVDALLGVRDALASTPEIAQFQWRSTVSWENGAGHCGLAMSRCLAARSVDHVVLQRGEVDASGVLTSATTRPVIWPGRETCRPCGWSARRAERST